MKARSWAIHGFYERTDDIQGEPIYRERVIGPKIGDAVVDVVEKSAYNELIAALKDIRSIRAPIGLVGATGGPPNAAECLLWKEDRMREKIEEVLKRHS